MAFCYIVKATLAGFSDSLVVGCGGKKGLGVEDEQLGKRWRCLLPRAPLRGEQVIWRVTIVGGGGSEGRR